MLSTQEYEAEGVIVQVIPYRDYDQIVVLFTRDYGLVKVFVKGARRRHKKGGGAGFSPLQLVEVLYKEQRGEIALCLEITPINMYLALRQDFNCLNAACDMLQTVYLSQLADRGAAPLYDLLLFYLDRLVEAPHPFVVACSFRLKVLKYEGLLGLQIDRKDLFSQEEEELAHLLMGCQSYSQLMEASLPEGFKEKVERLFRESFERQ